MDQAPSSLTEIVLLPGVFVIFGMFVWFGAWNQWRTYRTMSPWRWMAVVLFLVAAGAGWRFFWAVMDPGTKAFYIKTFQMVGFRKLYAAHFAVFIGPVLLAVTMFVWDRILRRQPKEEF